MRPFKSSHAGRRGFTLIELLVVVAIIALLVSILLPSLGRAKELARATICGQQMRQIGTALQGYAAENGGRFPLLLNSAQPRETDPWWDSIWFYAISDYTGGEPQWGLGSEMAAETNMYVCPSAKLFPKYVNWGVPAVSYISNERAFAPCWGAFNVPDAYAMAINPDLIERPQQQMSLVDGPIGAHVDWWRVQPWWSNQEVWGDEDTGFGSYVWYWHGGQKSCNVLCADGHTEMGVTAADGWKNHYQDPMAEDD